MEDIIASFLSPENQIYQLLIAVFLGTFIGLRRELNLQQTHTNGLMGLRTMPLLVLLGTISTFFPSISYLPVVMFFGLILFILVAYWNGVFKLQRIGLTTEITGLIMFLVGVLIGEGQILTAIIITVIVGLFNAYKLQLHKFAKSVSLKEWSGGLQLLIISLVILPLLPHEAIDPWGIIKPFSMWSYVVLLSGFGFIGYFINKYLGQKKSVYLTSGLGAIVSSTLVGIALAVKSKKRQNVDILSSALILAIAVMELRVVIEILILAPKFHWEFIFSPLIMFITTSIFVFLKYKSQKDSKEVSFRPKIKSPFEILPAIKFSVLLVTVSIILYFSEEFFGNKGTYTVALLTGFTDVEAVLLSILDNLKTGTIEFDTAWKAINISIITNTFVKTGYVYFLGTREMFWKVFWYLSIISLVGSSVFLIF